jgi:hypothetical protein
MSNCTISLSPKDLALYSLLHQVIGVPLYSLAFIDDKKLGPLVPMIYFTHKDLAFIQSDFLQCSQGPLAQFAFHSR